MDKSSKIFIAGHRGLVGSAILRRLQLEHYGSLVTRTREELDLKNQKDVENFFSYEKPQYVFMAAAKVGGIWANDNYPADFIYENLLIETNVIHAAYKYGVKKLLFLGSSCIYPKLAPQPLKEAYLLTGELEPTNEPYAIAKIAGIKMCQSYNRQYGTNFISVMPTNLYGPYDSFDLKHSHVLPALLRKLHLAKLLRERRHDEIKSDLKTFPVGFDVPQHSSADVILESVGITSESVTLWGSGEVYREFLYVDDLADACVFLMLHYDESKIINIGTGKDITIKNLATIINDIVGYEGKVAWDTSKPDGTPRKLLDVTKLKELGWKAVTELQEGIRRTYEWYKSS